MNVFKNTIFKKLIITICVIMMLFTFIIPKPVHAGLAEDIAIAPCRIIYLLEMGILNLINGIMCDEVHKTGDFEGLILISPETVIKGKFLLLDPNIFKEVTSENNEQYYDGTDNEAENESDTATGREDVSQVVRGRQELRKVFVRWYYALRTIAIVGLLSILVYVAIRMITSSISQDKAKYKVMLKDWIVALCLLFAMHYIMVGILNMSSLITDAIGTSGQNISLTERSSGIISHVLNDVDENGNDVSYGVYLWTDTNGEYGEVGKQYDTGAAYGQCLVLGAIVVYTFIFLVKYIKRMLTILFLILIAPICCITYPIDKIADGKAQAYNRWFQEFFFQVIIQPFHLLIYVVLVGSAITLASSNILYAIMCFAVMMPAEKFVREMFGFKDKLGSPLGAMATGALGGQLLSKAFSGGGSKDKNNKQVEGKSESNNSIRESKLNPGMPGDENATGKATTYDRRGRTGEETENGPRTSQGGQEAVEEQSTPRIGDGEEGSDEIDNERAEAFRNYRSEGLNQEEAEARVNEELPMDRNNPPLSVTEGEYSTSDDVYTSTGPNHDELPEEQPNDSGIYTPNGEFSGRFARFKSKGIHGIREHRDKKLMAKYGTKNRGRALGKFAARKGAKLGKKAIKGATTLAGATALGLFGAMIGQGSKGLAAGAALGANIGNRVNSGISSGFNTAREYGREARYAMQDEDTRRQNRVKEMMKSPDQIEKASQSFSKRNDGRIASSSELNQELTDRAKFKEMGLDDNQIDDAVDIYNKNKEELGDDDAIKMAYIASNYAGRYSAKDFQDPKKMENLYNSLMDQYEGMGVNQDLADESARAIISNAAAANKVSVPALKIPSRKDEYMNSADNIAKAEGYANRHLTVTQALEMGYNLRRAGLDEEQREQFFTEYINDEDARDEARNVVGDGATDEKINIELERRFEIKTKIGLDGEGSSRLNEKELTAFMNKARNSVKENRGIETPSNGQVYSEVKQMVTVKDSYNMHGSATGIASRVANIRKDEEKFIQNSADKAGARAVINSQREEVARNPGRRPIEKTKMQRKFLTDYSAREMQDDKTMEKAHKSIVKDLKKKGINMSDDAMRDFANEIIDYGKRVSGVLN